MDICTNCGHTKGTHHSRACGWRGCGCSGLIVSLTAKELGILRLLAKGLTIKDIARNFDRSVKTIDAQKCSLMRKTHATNSITLLAIALRCGVLTIEDLPAVSVTITAPERAMTCEP